MKEILEFERYKSHLSEGLGIELVEGLDPITERRAEIPQPQCLDQLFACRHADLPRQVALLPLDYPTGSNLREATGQHG